jgi:hypothetical protein
MAETEEVEMNHTCVLCGEKPGNGELPGTGTFIEDGFKKYICLGCWCIENYGPPWPDDPPFIRILSPIKAT